MQVQTCSEIIMGIKSKLHTKKETIPTKLCHRICSLPFTGKHGEIGPTFPLPCQYKTYRLHIHLPPPPIFCMYRAINCSPPPSTLQDFEHVGFKNIYILPPPQHFACTLPLTCPPSSPPPQCYNPWATTNTDVCVI